MQKVIDNQSKKMKDLEDYLDNLLLRVMETTPRILQNPYVSGHFDGNTRRQVSWFELTDDYSKYCQ